MCDWDQDEFMSKWDRTYVSTNLKDGARKYDREFFLGLNARLAEKRPELKDLSYALIVCGLYYSEYRLNTMYLLHDF